MALISCVRKQLIKAISTRSIQKLYDIKATMTKLKPKSLSVIDTY